MDAFDRWAENRRRGNYSMLMGVFIFVVLGFAALAVDVSYITQAEIQAQGAADSASHAALVAHRQHENATVAVAAGNAAAAWAISQNLVANVEADIQPGYPKYGSYNHNNGQFCTNCSAHINAVEVAVDRVGSNALGLLFAPFLGTNTADVDGHSITAQQKRAVMVVNDMSCSMMDDPIYSGDGTGAIHDLRAANHAFLDYLENKPQDGDIMGMSVFAETTTVDGGGNPVAWLPLTSIEFNASDIEVAIDGLCSTFPFWPLVCDGTVGGTGEPMPQGIGGCTAPDEGMDVANDELNDPAKTDITFYKAMIVMSDGMFNCNGGCADAVAEANTAWANDTNVYAITLGGAGFDTTCQENIIRGNGFQVQPSTAAELVNAFRRVAASLPTARVD